MSGKITFFFCFLFASYFCFCQDAATLVQSGTDLNVLYRNEATFGLLANSNGYGLNYRRGVHVTGTRKRVFEFELVTLGNPKEIKSTNPNYSSNGYYYGELNSVFVPRIGMGFQNVLFRKAERKSVEIRYSCYFGASFACAKPVYLEISPGGQNPVTERADPSLFTSAAAPNIYGSSSYFTGFNETSIYPGAYFKAALSFEYGSTRSDIKVIETGFTMDAYAKVIPQLAFSQNYQVFPSLYVSFIYGRKWF